MAQTGMRSTWSRPASASAQAAGIEGEDVVLVGGQAYRGGIDRIGSAAAGRPRRADDPGRHPSPRHRFRGAAGPAGPASHGRRARLGPPLPRWSPASAQPAALASPGPQRNDRHAPPRKALRPPASSSTRAGTATDDPRDDGMRNQVAARPAALPFSTILGDEGALDGFVRESGPQLLVTGDRTSRSAKLMFISSGRTRPPCRRKSLASANARLSSVPMDPEPTTAVTSRILAHIS